MPPLHPHQDVPEDVDAYVPVEPARAGWGWIPPAGAEPVAHVAAGARLAVDTLSHEGLLADQGRDPRAFFGARGVPDEDVLTDAVALAGSGRPHDTAVDGPHVLTGPIVVADARAGSLVGVHVRDLALRVPYGVVSQRPGRGLLADELPGAAEDGPPGDGPPGESAAPRSWLAWSHGPVGHLTDPRGRRVRFPVRPFLGLVAVGSDEPVHTTRPGPFGGNLDARRLGVGTTLWLPVRHDGAWVSVGDPHHAQGDGEVASTAVEGSLRATLELDVRDDDFARWWAAELDRPLGETPTHWLVPGFGETLDEACRSAVRAAVDLVARTAGVDRGLAYSALSAGADLQITQAVNLTRGAHVLVPREMTR